jgi:hypothetical protein
VKLFWREGGKRGLSTGGRQEARVHKAAEYKGASRFLQSYLSCGGMAAMQQDEPNTLQQTHSNVQTGPKLLLYELPEECLAAVITLLPLKTVCMRDARLFACMYR